MDEPLTGQRLHRTRQRLSHLLKTLWDLIWPVLLTLLLSLALLVFVGREFGDFDNYRAWRQDHTVALLTWRLALYTGIAWSWWSLRTRLQASSRSSPSPHWRLSRSELLALVAVTICELHSSGAI